MTRPTVLLFQDMHEAGKKRLAERCTVRLAERLDPEALRAQVRDVDGIVIRTAGVVDAGLLDAAPRLRVVGRHGVGVDQVDLEAATERGIFVVNTPGANTEAVAEHVIGMLLGLSKWMVRASRAAAAGDWACRDRLSGRQLFGRTLGIVGMGRIGRRLAEIAALGFAMRILYTDLVAAPEMEGRLGARRVELDALLSESEYVSLHVPLTPQTRRLIGAAELARMQPDAILINTARGSAVDTAALLDALRAGRLAGYGADVFEREPLPPDDPLFGLPNVFLTPHSAAHTTESLVNMALVADDVIRVLDGELPRHPVNDPERVLAARQGRS